MLNRPSFYIALVGVIAITALVLRLRGGDPKSQPLIPPPQTPYTDSVGARGIVESLNENVRIAPAVAGRIESVTVKVGDKVKTGDILFQIDSRQADSEVLMQEALVAVLDARVREAETILADRKDQLTRVNTLRQKAVASEDETKREQYAYLSAQRALERAQADAASGRAQLEAAKVRLDLLAVRAPRNGSVLQVNIRAGEYAPVDPSGDPLILLGDIATYQLRADVDESDAPRVHPGCQAVAYLKGTRSNPIPLEFVRIEPYVSPKRSLTGESTERVDTRVLEVIFTFQNPDVPIYVGQQMDVFIDATPPVAGEGGSSTDLTGSRR